MFILGLVMALGITPRLSGGSHVVVTSEAMAPSISSGDVALAHPVAPAYLAVGDVVAHYQGEDQVVRRLTHMYFDDADQVIALVTSADAVPGSEYRFDTEELIGRVVNYIPRTVSQFAVPVFAATSGVLVVLVATMLRRRGAAAR
jgi:signal peptidase I